MASLSNVKFNNKKILKWHPFWNKLYSKSTSTINKAFEFLYFTFTQATKENNVVCFLEIVAVALFAHERFRNEPRKRRNHNEYP